MTFFQLLWLPKRDLLLLCELYLNSLLMLEIWYVNISARLHSTNITSSMIEISMANHKKRFHTAHLYLHYQICKTTRDNLQVIYYHWAKPPFTPAFVLPCPSWKYILLQYVPLDDGSLDTEHIFIISSWF